MKFDPALIHLRNESLSVEKRLRISGDSREACKSSPSRFIIYPMGVYLTRPTYPTSA